jgi:hypothetical protein
MRNFFCVDLPYVPNNNDDLPRTFCLCSVSLGDVSNVDRVERRETVIAAPTCATARNKQPSGFGIHKYPGIARNAAPSESPDLRAPRRDVLCLNCPWWTSKRV